MSIATMEQVGPMWRCSALLMQARELIDDARSQPLPADRYRIAHLAALRASAALLAAYSSPGQRLANRPTSAWVLLTKVAPPMSAWAAYFAAGAGRRAAADAGVASAVSAQDADELIVSATAFLDICSATVAVLATGGSPDAALESVPAPPVRHVVPTAQAS